MPIVPKIMLAYFIQAYPLEPCNTIYLFVFSSLHVKSGIECISALPISTVHGYRACKQELDVALASYLYLRLTLYRALQSVCKVPTYLATHTLCHLTGGVPFYPQVGIITVWS